MPVDLSNNKEYKIDLNAIFDTVDSFDIFRDKNFQCRYIQKWIERLKKQDDIDMKNRVAQKYSGKYFNYPVNFPNLKVFINFDITAVDKFYNQNSSKFQRLSVPENRFRSPNGIFWTENEELVNGHTEEEHTNSDFPIYIVPIYSSDISLLVIDGNHRLTFKFKHGIRSVDAILFDFHTVANNKFFVTEFDRLLWMFKADVNFIRLYRLQNPDADDNELFSYSFLINTSEVFDYPIAL